MRTKTEEIIGEAPEGTEPRTDGTWNAGPNPNQEMLDVLWVIFGELELKEKNGELRRPNSRKSFSYTELLEEFDEQDVPPTKAVFLEAVKAYIAHLRNPVGEEEDSRPGDLYGFVMGWLAENKYSYTTGARWQREDSNGAMIDAKSMVEVASVIQVEVGLENTARVKIRAKKKSNWPPALLTSKESILGIIDRVEFLAIQQQDEKLREQLQFDNTSTFPLDAWVESILTLYGLRGSMPEAVLMFKQMMWCTKRHLYNQHVENRHMFVFYSPKQGIGKTRILRELSSLWPQMYVEDASLMALKDGKEHKALISGRISLCFDELALAAEDGMGEVLKQAITKISVSGRDNYANKANSVVSRATFTASSNLSVSDVFPDNSGMRRYFEFHLEPVDNEPYLNLTGQLDRDTIEAAYKAINETDDIGFYDTSPSFRYATLVKSVQHIQATYVNVEDKIAQHCKNSGTVIYRGQDTDPATIQASGYTLIQLDSFCKTFNRWMDAKGYKKWSNGTVMRCLKSRFFHITTVPTKNGGQEDAIYVKRGVTTNNGVSP